MAQVAAALAKADGLSEKNLSPVPEGLLKEAQQAAEEQRSMPGVVEAKSTAKKPPLPAGLEKMFQQAEAEQEVEKKAKMGTEVPPAPASRTLEVSLAPPGCTEGGSLAGPGWVHGSRKPTGVPRS